MTENTHGIWQAPIAGEVLFDAFLFLDARIKCVEDKRIVVADHRYLVWECKVNLEVR